MERSSLIERKTNETDISLRLKLDGSGSFEGSSGIGFFDHMLELFSRHGGMDLLLECRGDLDVDTHHTIEDIGICLGKAIDEALSDRRGIRRYATAYTPMDEALSRVSIDISGRAYMYSDVKLTREYLGDFETEMLPEFLRAVASGAGMTLHVNMLYGVNNHHMVESVFKGLGRAFSEAAGRVEGRDSVPSTKGVIG